MIDLLFILAFTAVGLYALLGGSDAD